MRAQTGERLSLNFDELAQEEKIFGVRKGKKFTGHSGLSGLWPTDHVLLVTQRKIPPDPVRKLGLW
jgi:hypothetical protein